MATFVGNNVKNFPVTRNTGMGSRLNGGPSLTEKGEVGPRSKDQPAISPSTIIDLALIPELRYLDLATDLAPRPLLPRKGDRKSVV